ncbi:TrmB family transcriptional regulator [Candidatus Woesearchaeota archaeon]|jgi:HTH-type transcriptional regulator, sugar sensing transcriptional regulator|nr:TrmB family transcriptional regulator [Candidatus Woesearchaeota archaeon]MBT6520391.1 TrmB family transcriptional regulator [Candidatus Woesearchaeota archaeon]MBT7368722.1 TrmB family transcriptional regulator [Candidatus Woesearchaeota archaeon]
MIVQKEFLSKLKDFGLNTYESKLWTALLSRGVSTAGELSDIANVPRSRSYDVLESLERKGFIIMKLGKPIKYVAVAPAEVLERVKRKVQDEATNHTKILDNLKGSDILSELNTLHDQGVELIEPTDISGALKGRGNLYNHIETMVKSAKSSVDIMTTTEGLMRKTEFLKNVLQKAKDKNLTVRIAAPLTKETKKLVKELKGLAEIRHCEKVRSRFCLIDGEQLTFMLLDDADVHPTYDAGVWVNTKFFSSALQQMFEGQWDGMKSSDIVFK